ncbi:hypothetical protein HAX54_002219 [Datura stramonium]|uniref:Plant bHLH transcription factor ACT-like domain-containing protein n=1 Tax=Datura stramonium TaxID=4076 RepID=A0ABS8RV78_DATST|nr:hypothetical protein [Datura stramonium]
MNKEGGDNDWLTWENDELWSFLNSDDDLVESGEKFAGDKLPDLRSDTCQPPTSVKEMDEQITVGRRRSSPKQKTNSKKKGKAKADKSTILDEAVSYIKTLQNTLQNLEEQKKERLQAGMKLPSVGREQFLADQGSAGNSAAITPTFTPLLMNNIPATSFQTWSSPNMVLNICGEEAHISICCPKKPALFSTICYVLEKHNIEIVSSQLSSDQYKNMFMIQAHARGGSSLVQSSEAFSVEEIYKQAASEIMIFMGYP